ncbi:DUF2065 domain-containing protein [Phaeovulum vinaykumarii]|uniref:Uncharacterized conserved protein YjeT, DUF2065 family n=1 Tax=Phaeovulum vinaykumarii TaxID=407234 RepID=A0A1N7JKL1_9RHOB|nr:DUF2065 domain-containing protein [Phaeovulum vinaykumarii]SIS49902.1 Uncharacterized conserved protein YjeT, DUF2065 family [Phaeovulum vinaykumarii]SOB89984.1 uncharacterized protein YjeT [Phaeovulum vinaykumarii]
MSGAGLPALSPGLIVAALAAVLIVEGLVLALAPRQIERVLAALAELSPEMRRNLGLVAMTIGIGLLWLIRSPGVPECPPLRKARVPRAFLRFIPSVFSTASAEICA